MHYSTTSIKFNPLSHIPLSSNFPPKQLSFSPQNSPNRVVAVNGKKKRDDYDGKDGYGRRVDENMIVLRMRIRDIKASEAVYEAPWYWMKWEKEWYHGNYNSHICEAMGILQRLLLDARPALLLGLLAFFMLTIFTSCDLLLGHLLPLLGYT